MTQNERYIVMGIGALLILGGVCLLPPWLQGMILISGGIWCLMFSMRR